MTCPRLGQTLSRRTFTAALIGAASLAILPISTTFAQDDFPNKPVRIIVPFGPGGLADITMRLAGEKLKDILGQQFVVENHPGAGGVAAANELLKAEPDGHTLVVMSNGTTIATSLFKNLGYDPQTQFMPISTLAWFDLGLFVQPDSDFNNIQEVVAYAKENPGALNIGTINPGSTQNLSAEFFRSVTGIDASIITYRTSPDILAGLIRGELDLVFESPTAFASAIEGGQAKILATTGLERNPSLPDIPTTEEAGIEGFQVAGWNALWTLAGTPAPIIEKLHAAIAEVAAMPDIQKRFAELNTRAQSLTPKEMADRFENDRKQWAKVIEDSGIEKR